MRSPVMPQMKSMIATTAIQNLVSRCCNDFPTCFMNLLLISGASWFMAVVAVETDTCNGATMSLKAEERRCCFRSVIYCLMVIQNIDMNKHCKRINSSDVILRCGNPVCERADLFPNKFGLFLFVENINIHLNYEMPTAEFVGFAETDLRNLYAAYYSRQFFVVQIHTVYVLSEKQEGRVKHDERRAFHHGGAFVRYHPQN